MILLRTSEYNGTCFVETKSLDGETNMKMKATAKKVLKSFSSGAADAPQDDGVFQDLKAKISCEAPNNALYKFEGAIELKGDKHPLGPDSLLLRGMNLRNTENAIGLCVFTGHDTKVMKNSDKAKPKFSRLDKMVNKAVQIIFCV